MTANEDIERVTPGMAGDGSMIFCEDKEGWRRKLY
jgi:hypothetical protein